MRVILNINLAIQKKSRITSSEQSFGWIGGEWLVFAGFVSLHLTEGVSYGES